MSTDPLNVQEMVVQQNQEILKRLGTIEAMLKQILHNSSPASLAVSEKARLVAATIPKGNAAVKELMRQLNGGK